MTNAKQKPDFSQRKMRACLGPNCMGKTKFLSIHPGHRLCPVCAHRVTSISCGSIGAEAA